MFKDRFHAGEVLADELTSFIIDKPCLLAIPRGGIVVAAPIAKKFGLKIDVLITRKVGHPLNPEVAIGAVMPDGSAVWDEAAINQIGLSAQQLEGLKSEQHAEIKRRMLAFTGTDKSLEVNGKTVILIDDGIATGYTIYAAVQWVKSLKPKKIILAVPVAPPDVVASLAAQADEVICPIQPYDFMAVGHYYQDFSQTTNAEVIEILADFR